MPNDPLGISFSPFGQQPQSGGQGGQSGAPAPTPQSAIQMLSFRTPRTVGANSPIPGGLLNAPGGAAFGGGGGQFGPAGGNLEQLLALLFGRMRGGVGALPEGPQAMGGGIGTPGPMPWDVTGPGPVIAPPKVRPGVGEPEPGPQITTPPPGGTAGPGPAPLPWEGPRYDTTNRQI
jgi:hypothetical protein